MQSFNLEYINFQKIGSLLGVVVSQLEERSLPIPEVRQIFIEHLFTVNDENKRKRMDHFLKKDRSIVVAVFTKCKQH